MNSARSIVRHVATDVLLKNNSKQHILKPFESIPGPKPLPVVGNIWRYLPLIGDYKIDQLYENALFNKKHYGPIVREQITKNHTILHLFDPDDIKTFTKHDGKQPYRRSHRALLKYRREYPERYNDGGLFSENGQTWLRLRRLFQPYLMSRSQVSMRAQLLDQITLESMREEQMFDGSRRIDNFEHFLHIWSLKCSLAVFLDYTREDMPTDGVLNSMIECLHHQLDAIDGTEIKSEKWTNKPDKCPFFAKLSQAESELYKIVSERVDYLQKIKYQPSNRNEEGKVSYIRDWLFKDQLDQKDVIACILDFILASIHTTAYTTTFFLEKLSKWNPTHKLDTLRREVREHMPPTSELLSSDINDDMPLLMDCFKETLRLHPVSIGTGRLTQNQMNIRGYNIPEGVMVIAHNQTICMDPAIYHNPNEFLPERWSEYRSSSMPSPFARMPFGFGPRICIGQHLSNLQISILVARLVQKFQWHFVDDKVKTKSMLVHCLDGHVRIEFNKIN